ncbi:Glycosyl transferase, family 11 [Candidatus Nanopelagicaceae bacterium]
MAISLRKVLNTHSVKNEIIFHSIEHIDELKFLLNFKPDKVYETVFLRKFIGNLEMRDANFIYRGMHKINLLKRDFLASKISSFSDIKNGKFFARINISESQHEHAFFECIKTDLLEHRGNSWFKIYSDHNLQIKNFDSAVAIHMRFGDFLDKNTADQYGNLDRNYYSKALEYFANYDSFHDTQIQLFSDDVVKGKKLLTEMGCTRVDTFETENLKPAEELLIMSKYSKIIISNSTFSWWAGYFAEDRATVIAPNPLMKKAASDLSRSPNWTYIDAWS